MNAVVLFMEGLIYASNCKNETIHYVSKRQNPTRQIAGWDY